VLDSFGLMRNLGAIFYCSTFNMFSGYQLFVQMEKKTMESLKSCLFISQSVFFVVLFTIGATGYITFRSNTKDYIIDNYIDENSNGDFVAVLIVLHSLMVMPSRFISVRENVTKLLSLPLYLDNSHHITMCLSLLSLILLATLILVYINGNSGKSFSIVVNVTGILSITEILIPAFVSITIHGYFHPYFYYNIWLIAFGLFLMFGIPSGILLGPP
jgi:amino acid permease